MKKLNTVAMSLMLLGLPAIALITGCDDDEPQNEYNVMIGNDDGSFSEYSCPTQAAYDACQSKSCGGCAHTSGPDLY